MADSLVLEETHAKHTLILTLNRPEKLNALNTPTLQGLKRSLQKASTAKDIYSVIVTGKGDKSFCAGADLKERSSMTLDETRSFVSLIQEVCTVFSNMPMVTIAAVNGIAMGGGLELALAADLRIMSRNAKVGLTECSLGIIPGAGGTQRLARIVGTTKANEMIFLAKIINAEEASHAGLANDVAKEGQTLTNALNWSKKISKLAPLSLRAAKKAIQKGSDLSLEDGLNIERDCYEEIISTKDRVEGFNAFLEKRKPKFTGA